MAGEIVNRVAESKLRTIDLEEHYPRVDRRVIDLKDWLFEGLVLREKSFREDVKSHDWSAYADSYVAIQCSSDAIVPAWAYMLLTTQLAPYAKKVVVGSRELLEVQIFEEVVQNMSLEEFADMPVIIKGCSDRYIPDTAYTSLVSRLMPVARSIMFGEACSSVPLYKKK